VQVGDRIIAINEYNVAHFTLSEASMFLQQCGHEANFTIEYDVSVMGMYIIRDKQRRIFCLSLVLYLVDDWTGNIGEW